MLAAVCVELEFDRVKNKNKNSCADKAIQEVEEELKRLTPHTGVINQGTLAIAISKTNNKIRSNGLSAREILMKRDNFTDQPIEVDDDQLKNFRYEKRLNNHPSSEKSKAGKQRSSKSQVISKGDAVHVKGESTKHNAREMYLVTSIDYERKLAEIQKFTGDQLKARKYLVNLSEIYLAYPHKTLEIQDHSEDEDGIPLHSTANESEEIEVVETPDDVSLRRATRVRNPPDWLATEEIEKNA